MFKVKELEFLGHNVTADGIHPSKVKTDAILSFRDPKNEAEIRSFLGLANYMNKFIPNLATIDEPLRKLTQKGIFFEWKPQHAEAFEEIKKIMSRVGQLGYYDVNDRTAVMADASPVGLGAILAQYDSKGQVRIISYASKSLTDTESRYCQTEKEALALVWAVERFQVYLLGKPFDLVTDCKALQFLFTPRSKPCARIERWVLRLQAFEYNVVHISGENNAADALSRLAVLDPKPFDIHEELLIREIVTSAANSMALNWEEIEKESIEDEEIQNVQELIRTDQQLELPLAYRVIAKELCQVGNVLLRTDRLVIPGRLRNRVLSLAHEGHPGSRMMKTHLRTHVWWPKLDQDVDRFVKSCRGCCLVSAPEAPEPMVRKKMPSAPWEDVAVDFLGPLPDGLYLLVVVDYYSRYVEVKEMISINVQAVIEELSVIFGRYGLPVSLRADNGPQLSENCNELKTFCLENGIKLVNTIPYWPQQNGEVERQNRTILKRLRIAQELGKSWRKELSQYLLVYHSTNHPTTGKSPSELMFGRRIRSKLPQVPVYHSNDEEVRDMDRLQKEKGREYSDKKRKANHSKIEVGDEVLIKRMKKNNKLDTDYINEEFVVVRKQEADCTLKSIKTGREYRRNVAHLKKIEKTTSNEGSVSQYGNEEGESNVNNNEALTEQNRTNRTRKEPHHFKDYVPY